MDDAASIAQPTVASRFLYHIMRMPSWHKYVLMVAMAFAAVGGMGRVRQLMGTGPIPASTPAQTPAPQNTSGSTSRNNFANAPTPGNAEATDANAVPWYLSPRFLSIGGSVLGGFVVGWLMRVFVKMTALIGLTLGALIAGLSYFHVMNVDFTSMQQHYNSDVSWLGDQASRLKDVAIGYLPVHTGGLFGMFMGFRRPKL
jgi:uncharacterized membrane protein (Fun14 family)